MNHVYYCHFLTTITIGDYLLAKNFQYLSLPAILQLTWDLVIKCMISQFTTAKMELF